MNKLKKLTVDNLIELKTGIKEKESVEFESQTLGGIITIRRLSRTKFKSIISKLDKNSSDEEAKHVEDKLIYEHMPLLHNKKLQSAYEVKAPYDIVSKIFCDNVCEIDKISAIIYGFYGYDVEALKAVKKQ